MADFELIVLPALLALLFIGLGAVTLARLVRPAGAADRTAETWLFAFSAIAFGGTAAFVALFFLITG